jgi:L-2-hydroxycarboxylate dehydrogenase (NAD+)
MDQQIHNDVRQSAPKSEAKATRFSADFLRRFIAEVFMRYELSEEDAMQAANVICVADEWGISSHGVARLRSYCDMLALGRINPKATPRVVRESATVAVIDGDNGLGLVVAPKANHIAIEKAAEAGTAWISVFNSNHFGIAGYYAIQGAFTNMIGWAATNTPALVSPLWGLGRVLGTNPLAVAIPAFSEPPIVIDLATSMISLGVVENALRSNEPLPTGCIADHEGASSTDPTKLFAGGSLLPLGGDRQHGGHKGYCLAALIDILCGVLSGASWGPFVPPFPHNLNSPDRQVGQGIGHLFGMFSISAFTDTEGFKQRVDDWIRVMRSTPPAPGTDGVQIPGDPERRAAADAAANGIPVAEPVVNDLRLLGQQFGIAL